MDFGLGLVLSLTDNASTGLNNASDSLMRLTSIAQQASDSLGSLNDTVALQATAMSANTIGDGLVSMGKKLTGTFLSLVNKVRNTGQEYEDFGITLNAIYKDAGKANTAMKKLMDFSVRSPLEIGEVKDFLITLKSQGVEPFEKMKGAVTGTRQETLAWLTDLKSFRPDVPATRFKMAIQNYVGSGEKKQMRTVFDLGDIEQIIGHKMGKTAEKRMQDIVEMVEKTNLTGLSNKLAVSWTGVASNVDDAFTKLFKTIADNGVFENLKGSFLSLSSVIVNMPEDKLKSFGKTIASGLNIVVKPLSKFVEKVSNGIDSIVDLCSTHPNLVKFGTVLVAVAGAGLLLGGVAFKTVGALANFALTLKMLNQVGGSTFGIIRRGFASTTRAIFPLIAVSGLLYLAWSRDFGGIRTLLGGYVKNVSSSFKTASNMVNGSATEMHASLDHLNTVENPWDRYTLSFAKFIGVFKFGMEALNGYTLSEESWQKARQLGILPVIESILDLKYRFESFSAGFKKGWSDISNNVKNFTQGIVSSLENTPFEGLIDKFKSFLDIFNSSDADNWKRAGEVFAHITAKALGFFAVFKLVGGVTSKVSKLSSVLNRFTGGGLLGRVFGGKSGGNNNTGNLGGGLLSSPVKVAKTMGSLAIILGGFSLIIAGLGALTSVPYFNTFMSSGPSIIPKLFNNIVPLASGVGILSLLFKGMDMLKVSPTTALKGMGNLAIILGGISRIALALGALTSVPYFGSFITTGAQVMATVADTLKSMFSLSLLGTIGIICGLGVVPIPVVLAGLLNLAMILGGVTLIVEAFGALSKISGFNDFLVSGGKTLSILFNQLGNIVGSAIGGFTTGITDSLPTVADNLSLFGTRLRPFFGALSGAPLSEIGAFAKGLGSFFLELGAENVLSFIGGDVDLIDMANQLSQFGPKAKDFFDAVASYPDKGLVNAKLVFEAIGGIGSYDFKSGGLAQVFTGDTRLDIIGEQLASFAPNGAEFFNSVAGYSEKGIEKAKSVFDSLGGIGDYDFKGGGLAQLFTGETRLDKIGEQLAEFAPNGKTFFDEVAKYNETGIQRSKLVFDALGGLGNYDFKSGGIAQWITGKTDLGDLGEQLTDFAEEAKDFFDTMAIISDRGIYNGISVVNAICKLAGFKSGGLLEAITGRINLVSVGEQLAKFAPGVKYFFDGIQDISDTAITNGARIFSVLGVIGNSEFRSGGFIQLFTGEVSLDDIGKQLSSFADTSKNFFEVASGLNPKGFENAVSIFKSLEGAGAIVDISLKSNGSLQNFGNELVSFAKSMVTFKSTTQKLGDVSGTFNGMSIALNNFSSTLDSVSGNVQKKSISITSSLSKMASSVSRNLEEIQKKFSNCTLKFPEIKTPHFKVDGGFNFNTLPPKAPNVSVNWYKDGGVFSSPTIIGVGEAGKEAVMPLENNTGWISNLSTQLASNIGCGVGTNAILQSIAQCGTILMSIVQSTESIRTSIDVPEDNSKISSTITRGGDITNVDNTSNTTTTPTEIDNSIHFDSGSIVINVKELSNAEIDSKIDYIIRRIKRKKEIHDTMMYKS